MHQTLLIQVLTGKKKWFKGRNSVLFLLQTLSRMRWGLLLCLLFGANIIIWCHEISQFVFYRGFCTWTISWPWPWNKKINLTFPEKFQKLLRQYTEKENYKQSSICSYCPFSALIKYFLALLISKYIFFFNSIFLNH